MMARWSAFSAAKWSMSTAWDRSWERSESRSLLLFARAAEKRASALCGGAVGADARAGESGVAAAPGAAAATFARCRRRRSRCLLAQRVEQNRCDLRDGSKRSPHSLQIFPLTGVHQRRRAMRHDLP